MRHRLGIVIVSMLIIASAESRGYAAPAQGGRQTAILFPTATFMSPSLQCAWTGTPGTVAPAGVTMTPLVLPLNGDGVPDVIFSPFDVDGTQRLVAIRASDCSLLFDRPAGLMPYSQLAAGELDASGYPEIVGLRANRTAAVFDHTGVLLATSPVAVSYTSGPSPFGYDLSAPVIVDLGNGHPDIVIGGLALEYTPGQRTLQVLWSKPVLGTTWGTLDTVADLDGDDRPEVIVGPTILDGLTGNDVTPPVLKTYPQVGGYTAVADFNGDKKPDIVLIQSAMTGSSVSVIDVANDEVIFGPIMLNDWLGPPVVADFDGDGIPDIGVAGSYNYYVFSMRCSRTPRPVDCRGVIAGVLWSHATRDTTSGGSGSSAFDFNQDGRAEVVYRDQCWLRVFDGADGRTLIALPVSSGTGLELPTVAGIAPGGRAAIVVSSDSIGQAYGSCGSPEADTGTPWTGYTDGVFVLRDPLDRWALTRPLWNEHSYHITNINKDLTIPEAEAPSWLLSNTYRANRQVPTSVPAPTISSFSPTSGEMWAPVIVSGTNLAYTTEVMFTGGASAFFQLNLDGTLTVGVPYGAETGPITVSTSGGSATSAEIFTPTSPE